MKRVYFNLSNGEVVVPSEFLPAYYAEVDASGSVQDIFVCYSQANIDRHGDLWALRELLRDREAWTGFVWLKSSLNKFLVQNYSKSFRDFEKELAPHYIYVPVGIH